MNLAQLFGGAPRASKAAAKMEVEAVRASLRPKKMATRYSPAATTRTITMKDISPNEWSKLVANDIEYNINRLRSVMSELIMAERLYQQILDSISNVTIRQKVMEKIVDLKKLMKPFEKINKQIHPYEEYVSAYGKPPSPSSTRYKKDAEYFKNQYNKLVKGDGVNTIFRHRATINRFFGNTELQSNLTELYIKGLSSLKITDESFRNMSDISQDLDDILNGITSIRMGGARTPKSKKSQKK